MIVNTQQTHFVAFGRFSTRAYLEHEAKCLFKNFVNRSKEEGRQWYLNPRTPGPERSLENRRSRQLAPLREFLLLLCLLFMTMPMHVQACVAFAD